MISPNLVSIVPPAWENGSFPRFLTLSGGFSDKLRPIRWVRGATAVGDPAWRARLSSPHSWENRPARSLDTGRLSVSASQAVSPEREGVARARSASEAFLYRRLETLPEAAGLFRLNVRLPIPFDGWGQMEVDLLWADGRVAIELDGRQHLDNAEAYRRDRRKDVLLQENGYFVLRFLAEDVGKHLDTVLDAILRTLSQRRRS